MILSGLCEELIVFDAVAGLADCLRRQQRHGEALEHGRSASTKSSAERTGPNVKNVLAHDGLGKIAERHGDQAAWTHWEKAWPSPTAIGLPRRPTSTPAGQQPRRTVAAQGAFVE